MTRDKIVETLRDIIVDQTGIPESEFDNDTQLRDSGLDSLDIVELVIAIEDEFAIDIDDEELDGVETINQFADLVASARS